MHKKSTEGMREFTIGSVKRKKMRLQTRPRSWEDQCLLVVLLYATLKF